ncbi:MAG: polysaccharide deacetylase family protein [Bacteroidota bacterium]|nr:polysaccharide deacetylase family protein [Bacteroidota bacterium]
MEARPIKIFTSSNVPRLRYIADLILNDILGLSWEIVTDKRKVGKSPVINYSDDNITGSVKINPVPLLFETGIKDQGIEVTEWKSLPVFFRSTHDAEFPFDIFAASFYLVTRYEEYLEFSPDEHGRFRGSDSLAYRNGFLGIPVVDLWAKELAIALVRKYQSLAFKRNTYRYLVTADLDEPYAHAGKSLAGKIEDFIHDLAGKSHRSDSQHKGEKDPYDVFDYMLKSIETNGSDARFFFPAGNHSEFDKNPSWKSEEYRTLIAGIADKFPAGLHPSYQASFSLPSLKTEIDRLRKILGKEFTASRFHYLRISMPLSYRNLSSLGITEDFSMGFHDEPGFRAGIARPFMFYDVQEDRITSLKIFPFQLMDVTLTGYKKLTPDSARDTFSNLISQTRKVGGLFISIWHNTTLLDNEECRAWREVFEYMLKEQKA